MELEDDGGPLVIDARPMVREVVADLDAGVTVGRIAARFHNALAEATALTAERRMTDRLVLSGGVFTPERIPPNDGGIAYGQLAVAAARVAAEDGGADVRA